MDNTIEGFEYINLINTIEGISVSTFNKLLRDANNVFGDYSIKYTNSEPSNVELNGIIIFDKGAGKRISVCCVKNYYHMVQTICPSIQEKISSECINCNCDCYISDCKDCHKACISLEKLGIIKRKF